MPPAARSQPTSADRPEAVDLRGRAFVKMCGSGNDFAFFDGFADSTEPIERASAVVAVCARGTGVGVDGLVVLAPPPTDDPSVAFTMRYYNRDGSRASLCGNAALCAVRLAVELGRAPAEGFRFETDAGVMSGRISDGLPEIDLRPVAALDPNAPVEPRAGERRIGFVDSGVPHLVVEVDDVARFAVADRGRELRHHPSLTAGANVNALSRVIEGWRMRTYERGVEGETLACGTGAVACAALLQAWGEASDGPVRIITASGSALTVRPHDAGEGAYSLSGEGRVVFRGVLAELPVATGS